MKYVFAIAYLLIGLVIATRVRNVSGRFALAFPNALEHAARERIACWFQLVLFLTLLVLAVRLTARFAVCSGERAPASTTGEGSLVKHAPAIDQTERARERLFADFYFELNQIPEEQHPKH
jgi:hypothetical protein